MTKKWLTVTLDHWGPDYHANGPYPTQDVAYQYMRAETQRVCAELDQQAEKKPEHTAKKLKELFNLEGFELYDSEGKLWVSWYVVELRS